VKCVRCQRPLLRAAITIGPRQYGPKCAKAAGLTESKARRKKPSQRVEDARQLDWVAALLHNARYAKAPTI